MPHDADGKRKRITDLDPIEVTLTFAPAIREDFIMAKSEGTPLDATELSALAKSLQIEKAEDIPPDKLQAAMAAKASGQPITGDPNQDDPTKQANLPGDPDPKKMPDDDPTKKPDPFANLDKSVSQAITEAAKALMPHFASLPPEIAKFFQGAPQPDPMVEPSNNPADPSPQLEAVKTELSKSNKELAAAGSKITNLEQQLTAIQDKSDLEECRVIAKSISPNVEGTAQFLLELKKNGITDADFKEYVEGQRRMYVAASESDAFAEISKSEKNGEGATAYDKVMKMAQEMVAKSENPADPTALAKSIQAVLDLNPELATQYEQDVDKSITAVRGSEEA
jgi:hypothetical protein